MTRGLSGNWIVLGKVIRPHGLEGLVRVRSYAESETSFEKAEILLSNPVSGKMVPCRVLSARPHKNIVLMRLEGIDSIEAADGLREAEVLVPAETIPREEGQYLWQELIGLRVFLDSGEYIGHLLRIIDTGGNEIYVVGSDKKEIYLPATQEVVTEIDLEKRRMIISAMEGLLDLNEV